MSELTQFIDSLPMVNQDAISVGFNSITSIKPLKEFLEALLGKEVNDIIKNDNILDQKNEKLNTQRNKELRDRLDTLNKITGESLEETKKIASDQDRRKQFDAKLFTVLKVISEGVAKQFESADKVAKTFIDLEKGGVFLTGGVNSLGKAAADLGMTYEGLANQLKKTSPLIAKMNANMGDGLEVFKNTIQSIDDKYNLSRAEQVDVFEAVMDKITPSQMRQLSQEELTMEVNETAKQMKLLSIATGKSVEQLTKEQEIKSQQMRVQAYARTHKQSYSLLKSLGFDDEMIDYIASGGVKTNSKILLQQMNSPAMQKMLPEIMRMSNNNRLTTESLGALINQNRQYIGAKTRYANRMAFDQGSYGAAASSDMYQYAVYDNSFDEMMAGFNPYAGALYNGRAADNNMIGNVYSADRAHNTYDTEVLRIKSGTRDGINADANIRKGLYGTLGSGLGFVNNGLEKTGIAGFLSGTIASSLTAAVPHVKNWLYSAFGNNIGRTTSDIIFALAVNKFSKSVGYHSNIIGSLKNFFKHPLLNTMNLGKKFFGSGIGRGLTGLAGGAVGIGGIVDILNDDTKGTNTVWGTTGKGALYGLISGAAIGGSVGGKTGAFWGAIAGASSGALFGMAKNFVDNWDSKKGFWSNITNGLFGRNNEEVKNVQTPSIKPYTTSSLATPKTSLDYERNQFEIWKDIRDYTRVSANSSQTLIDIGDENNKLYAQDILYQKIKHDKEV